MSRPSFRRKHRETSLTRVPVWAWRALMHRVSAGERHRFNAEPIDAVDYHFDLDYVGDGIRDHRLDVLVPHETPGPLPVYVYFHGGGWTSGDKAPLTKYAASQAVDGMIVVNANYRMATRFHPGPTAQLAGPIAATLQSNAVGLTDRTLESERFRSLWTTVNRTAHTAFVKVANGDDGALLATSGGAFVIDLRELLVEVADRIGLPGTLIERIPADAGQLTVFESDQVNALQQAAKVLNLLSVFLLVLVVVLYSAAVFFAADRRVALRNVGIATIVGSVLLLIAQQLTIDISVEQLARADSGRAAVGALVSIATSLLNQLVWSWLAMGVVIVAFAVLIGPSRAAVATRGLLAPVMTHPVGAWALALGALGLYLVLAPGVSIDRWFTAVIFAVLFVAAVELLRRQIVREHPLELEHDET